MYDKQVESAIHGIPHCSINAGPRSAEWPQRVKEELRALIAYIKINKQKDTEWFNISSNTDGTKWTGMCWYLHNRVKYTFKMEFEIPAAYPMAPIELSVPELEGKTPKMYRGGKICLDAHFAPLWHKNAPKYGIVHLFALGLGPWLVAEIPFLIDTGMIQQKDT